MVGIRGEKRIIQNIKHCINYRIFFFDSSRALLEIIINMADVPSDGKRPPLPNCIDVFDRFWFCASPVNQLAQFYRQGELENCTILLSDWSKCMRSKLHQDVDKKYEIMASASVMVPPIENRVWEYKEAPSWTLSSSDDTKTGNSNKNTTSSGKAAGWWWLGRT